MIAFILKIIFAIFAIFGLADFLHFLKGLILKPNKRINYNVNIEIFDNQIEQLNVILDEFRWSKTVKCENLNITCVNISDNDFLECERIAKIYGVKVFKKGM